MSSKKNNIPAFDLKLSWINGWKKIKKLNVFDKYMTLFWLLGPFIYLIERDPADLWLTAICIIFFVRCVMKKDWSWASQFWFKCALLLWAGIAQEALHSRRPSSIRMASKWASVEELFLHAPPPI